MKLKVYFKPALPVGLLVAAACLFWIAFVMLGSGLVAMAVLALALFYTALAAMGALALLRLAVLERWQDWPGPARLLILAPHEDDCVISAGGVGAQNSRIGGTTRIVYLAPDEASGMAERRAGEAREAWRVAGVVGDDVRHLDLLPPLRQRDPQKLRAAAGKLRAIIDEFAPTVIVVPMFEGGHVHHDMLAALIGTILTDDDRFEVFEAPEYSPYASLWYTPHRVIALCSRWLFGLVSYYGPPDGIDSRPVTKISARPGRSRAQAPHARSVREPERTVAGGDARPIPTASWHSTGTPDGARRSTSDGPTCASCWRLAACCRRNSSIAFCRCSSARSAESAI